MTCWNTPVAWEYDTSGFLAYYAPDTRHIGCGPRPTYT